MVDYAQLRNLDTAKLTAAAESAGSLSGTMSTRGGEVATASAIPPGMWTGGDANAAGALMSPLSSPLYDVSDSASQSQGVIDELVGKLNDAKNKLDDAVDVIAGTGITIGADGTITTPVVNDPAVAAENDRKAKQAKAIIDAAIEMANKADDAAVGGLASAGSTIAALLGPPSNSPLGPWGTASWGLSQGIGRFGNLASYMGNVQNGRFAPRGYHPNGRYGFLSPKNMSALERAKAGANGQFVAKPGQSGTRAGWNTASKVAGRAGGAVSVVTSTAKQAATDWNNPNLTGDQKVGRAGWRGATEGGGAVGGGLLGAKLGAGVGTLIAPGVGTVVGGAVGGVVGGIAGSKAGGWIADKTVGAAGDVFEKITPW